MLVLQSNSCFNALYVTSALIKMRTRFLHFIRFVQSFENWKYFAAQVRPYTFHERRIFPKSQQLSDYKFQRIFGVSRPNYDRLATLVCPHLPPGLSTNGKSLTPDERLLVFLNWARTGNTNIQSEFCHGISEGAVHDSLVKVIDAMYTHVCPQLIKLPNETEARHEADLFYNCSGFPRIAFAAIDGTHVKVSFNNQLLLVIAPSIHFSFISVHWSLALRSSGWGNLFLLLFYYSSTFSFLAFFYCSLIFKQILSLFHHIY